MKTVDQAITEFKSGKILALGEYRSSRAEKIQWRDKETQRILTGVTLTHSVELDGNTILLSERVPDDFDPKNYTSPFPKGASVVVHIQGLYTEKGVNKARGTLEEISATNGTAKPAPAKI